MALADYYGRGSLAAAQALGGGYEDSRFRALLEQNPLGIAVDRAAIETHEGRALLDMTIRLAARLFPVISLDAGEGADTDAASELARAINPQIELVEGIMPIGIAIGAASRRYECTIYAGSDGWEALLSTESPQPIGGSQLPFGAGAAACLALAAVFRSVFLPREQQRPQFDVRYSTFAPGAGQNPPPPGDFTDDGRSALIGAGAIGNAAVWALARAPITGTLHIVDPEQLELSNLQRYVLATLAEEGAAKAPLAANHLTGSLMGTPHAAALAQFLSEYGYAWDRMLLALDSARDRRFGQASLPRWIANAWTQPGDLGLSVHPSFESDGACVSCLYLLEQELASEDQLIAEALGIPDQRGQVRQLLVTGAGLPGELAALIAQRLARPPELLAPFAGRPVRELYVQGICGGAVLPLGSAQFPRAELHVPLAHQSALAGVLLAAAYARSLGEATVGESQLARLDVMRPTTAVEPQPNRKRGDGRCICEDVDFLTVYREKWSARELSANAR
jgi:Prokaryotic E2 family C/ThiF family